MEDLETFELSISSWQKTSGELLSDVVMQALAKEQALEKVRGHVETTTFAKFGGSSGRSSHCA